jgi:hypothetical protein
MTLLLAAAGSGCGPEFPPSWLVAADPTDAGGVIDPAGKLRVLAVVSDPPEVMPGSTVMASALVVTHPSQGLVMDLGDGTMVRSSTPRGLDVQWRLCQQADADTVPGPCGTAGGQPAPGAMDQLLPALPGPATSFVAPAAASLPSTLVLTLFAADAALPGGAAACRDQAVQQGGVSPNADHCVIAIKRVKVSASAAPNHDPALAGIYLGAAEPLAEISTSVGSYPLLASDVDDSARPQLTLAAERAGDAVESEPDPDHPEQQRPETLGASFFTTAGTLDAGRGSFLDLGCAQDPTSCPQEPRSSVNWQPPAARAALEAPDGVVYFFVVLRDDRGGGSFRLGRARAR